MSKHLAQRFVDLSRLGFASQAVPNLALIIEKVVSTFERL